MKTCNAANEKETIGKYGEEAAAKHLKKNGYKLIAKNVHAGRSELDLIATKDKTLVFAEVKTRSYDPEKPPLSRPADAVNKSKVTYLIRGADRFCAENTSKFADFFKRIDIIEVYLEKTKRGYKVKDVLHFENAVSRN